MDYLNYATFQVTVQRITRDSIGTDGSHTLFYNNDLIPLYRVDTAFNVFLYPQSSVLNFLWYKLDADSCDSWICGNGATRWAWVAGVDSESVYGLQSTIKQYKYAPGNPCSLGSLEEHWLADGFGLVHYERELEGPTYLMGCIIAGDTLGFLTSTETIAPNNLPRELILQQNYPNPFNPATTIEFDLPKVASVRVQVFDVMGRECVTLLDKRMLAGIHRVRWGAAGMASGVYFCRIRADDLMRTIKMILAR